MPYDMNRPFEKRGKSLAKASKKVGVGKSARVKALRQRADLAYK